MTALRYAPRHYDTPQSLRARRRADWRRAWLLLDEAMERGDDDAADLGFALTAGAAERTEAGS